MSEAKTIEELREQVKTSHREAFEAKAFYELWVKRPDLHCEANESLIRDFLKDDVIGPQTISEAVDYLDKQGRLGHIDESDERETLVDVICSQEASPDRKKELRRQMESRFTTMETLREKAKFVEDARKFRAMPVEELRQVVKNSSTKYETPQMPSEYDAEWLRHTADFDLPKFRTLIRKFGLDQVNARLRGEK